MLAISVVNNMERKKAEGDDDEVLLYFSATMETDDCNMPEAIWADLSHQLLDLRSYLGKHILDDFSPFGECSVSLAIIFETLLRHHWQRFIDLEAGYLRLWLQPTSRAAARLVGRDITFGHVTSPISKCIYPRCKRQ